MCGVGARTGPPDVQKEGPLPAVTPPSSLTSLPALPPRERDVYVRVCVIVAATRVRLWCEPGFPTLCT